MKKRRHSQISDSEDSEEAPRSQNSSKTVAFVANNRSSSSDSSDSSSDAGEAPKRTSSLLDRTTPSTSPRKSVSVSPIKKFIEQNPDLTQLRINDVLSEDDDVCFLEIPKTIDPGHLIDKIINFDRRTKIKVNKTRYVIEPNHENVKPITILTNKLKVVHPVANLQFREYTKRKSDGASVEAEKVTPSLPENLKVRHPLFGAKYEKKIVLDEEIQQKLDNSIEQFRKTLKKKKKKHKERPQEEQLEQEESIFTLLETHNARKKEKKIREGEEVEANQESISTSFDREDGIGFKKHKKKKKKVEEVGDFEEEKQVNSVETCQRDSLKKKHKKKKHTEDEEMSFKSPEVYNNFEASPAQGRDSFKKKHKKKQSEDEAGENASTNWLKFEKMNKGSNPINSTVIPGLQLPSFDFDISNIMNREERGKMNCDDEFDDPSNTGKQQESIEVGGSVRKKKKKRDKSEDEDAVSPKKRRKRDKGDEGETDHLILDIMSRIKNEMEKTPFTKHKKKKKSER